MLQRSKSFCQTEIEKLLDNEGGANELIGDFTKVRKTAASPPLIVEMFLTFSSNRPTALLFAAFRPAHSGRQTPRPQVHYLRDGEWGVWLLCVVKLSLCW